MTEITALFGAIGTVLTAVGALVELWIKVRKGEGRVLPAVVLSCALLISAPLATYGTRTLYARYRDAYDIAARTSKVALFAPEFAPAFPGELGENSQVKSYISPEQPEVPDALTWYTVDKSREGGLSERAPLRLEYPKPWGYYYWKSQLDREKWGWSGISLNPIQPISLGAKKRLVLIINAQHDDAVELKLGDISNNVAQLVVPLKRGWAAYVIQLDQHCGDIDLNQLRVLVMAHTSHQGSRQTNTFRIALVRVV